MAWAITNDDTFYQKNVISIGRSLIVSGLIMAKKKPAKPRAKNYDTKLAINGTFGEVMKVFVDTMTTKDTPAPKPIKLPKKK